MTHRLSLFVSLGFIYMVLGSWLALPASGVWEHAAINPATRLPTEQSTTWEMSLIFNLDAVYPANLYCPAGFTVVIHVLNVSPADIVLKRGKNSKEIWVPSGGYYRWKFGQVQTGDHPFHLDLVLAEEPDHTGDDHEEASPLQICHVRAGTWPGSENVYHTAWIAWSNRLYPSRLPLPTGRHCQIFLGAGGGAYEVDFTAQGQIFQIKPGHVTLTELLNHRGERSLIAPAAYQPVILHAR